MDTDPRLGELARHAFRMTRNAWRHQTDNKLNYAALVSGALLVGAFVSGAFVSGAFVSGAFVSGAFVSGAFVSRTADAFFVTTHFSLPADLVHRYDVFPTRAVRPAFAHASQLPRFPENLGAF